MGHLFNMIGPYWNMNEKRMTLWLWENKIQIFFSETRN